MVILHSLAIHVFLFPLGSVSGGLIGSFKCVMIACSFYVLLFLLLRFLASEERANSSKLCTLVSYREDFLHKAWLEILETSQAFSWYVPSLAFVCNLQFEEVGWFLLRTSPYCL